MYSKSEIVKNTISQESFYILEKSGTAIHKEPGVDVELAIKLLLSYKTNLLKLKHGLDQENLYNKSFFDYEFETTLFAITKLANLLEQSRTQEQNIEASIYHKHISLQDEIIRKAIDESEGYFD